MLTKSPEADLRERVLLLEGINASAVQILQSAPSLNVERIATALDEQSLGEMISEVGMLGIRSRTELTSNVIGKARKLLAVGCFSVGTNQVDLETARIKGIPVFNAPFSNTRSVAELVIGEIIMLFRGIFPKSVKAHAGQWEKSAAGRQEVRGRTLGIVGYGNIGSQLSTLAESLGMKVIYYDRYPKLRHGNAEPVESLTDLLAASDIVSLHVPDSASTHGMIGENELRAMKRGSYLINNSRGTVVDLGALAAALRDRHIAGAAVDVFPVEPSSNSERFTCPLQGLDNVILTPHIGGSTEEAQERIGLEVARKMLDYITTGSTIGAVNFPQLQLPGRSIGTRFSYVHRNVPGVLRGLNEVFLHHDANILAQHLETEDGIGYVVMDVDLAGRSVPDILDDINAIDGTIKTRILYEN